MTTDLSGKSVAFLMANEGVEQVELTKPLEALRNAGATCHVIATEAGSVQAYNHLDKGDTFTVDLTTAEATAASYDAVVLPGGVTNPDQLRTDDNALRLVREVMAQGKPVAAICHAPWTLVEAGLLDGRTLTSWPSLATDVRNAGGSWVDQEVVTDGNLITSRKPDDLPAFCETVVAAVGAA